MIVFIHIPKTGGTTLNRVVEHLAGNKTLIVNCETELGCKMAAFPPGKALELDYISGHVRLGFVRALLEERIPPSQPKYVTLLRDPVERAFSLYLFVLRVPTAIPHVARAVKGRDFAYFLDYAYDNAEWHLRDAQAWLLCGERSAQRAKEAIADHFSVVGTTDAWDRFYDAVARSNGLTFPEDTSGFIGNVAPKTHDASDIGEGSKPADWREAIGAASIRKLEHLNQADCELYDFVVHERNGLITNLT